MTLDLKMFIDGKWTEAESGARYSLPNPATEATMGSAPDGQVADLRRAIDAARRAFDEGPWRRIDARDRGRLLHQLADGIERRKEEFRQLLIGGHGAEFITHPIQLDKPIDLLRNYAELATRFEFERPLPHTTSVTAAGEQLVSSVAYRQPVGVCGLIPTWNFPLFVTAQKIGPALATGCTMVIKPSPYGPLVDLLLAEVVEELDLPAGVFNVVTGQSPDLGSELSSHPAVDKISFTGSVGTGKRVMEAASRTLKRIHLELGGKSAQIILDDFDLDAGALSAAAPSYFHAGQGCAMTTRVLIGRERHDALLERMQNFVENVVRVGDPADPGVFLGPVIREERRQAIEGYIATGREEGATLVTGGGRPEGLEKGYFVEPTIFGNVSNLMRIAREEIFGPVVSVIPFDDEADAIRIANESSFGLYGGILTRDVKKGLAMAKQIRSGGVGINNASNLLYAPFGGFKESGIGRENHVWGMEEFTELQAISWPA